MARKISLGRVRSPFRCLMRKEDSFLDGRRGKSGLSIKSWILLRRPIVKVFNEIPKPRDSKPQQCYRLKREAETECALIGDNWIVPILGCPPGDDETNSVLNHECPA